MPKQSRIETRKIAFKELSALKRGDFVVHADYGIGIYKGLKSIKALGKERECVVIEYKDRDTLYVPLEKWIEFKNTLPGKERVPLLLN